MDEKPNAVETASARETEALGIRLACSLSGGMLVTLEGELGSGKTVLVRGIACGLKVPPGVIITSPTYVLQHVYRGGRLTLYHIDLYRIVGGAAEFEASGLHECFDDAQGLVCVEWPERLPSFKWPEDRVIVQIEHAEPQRRRIALTASGPRSREALERISSSSSSRIPAAC
ncbi:MAG: tRNA (adenosine(37)-N6)-threonylcarbamoyltransferase complex ATPase subunit type 1 TsaE [Planctomycetota bacterium]|nr:tRNA (adenosine(37)-N6)-threonylcarbamoyltransferase complex ATPase subunit type 1 TsaE [Planctomycetota bacterium]